MEEKSMAIFDEKKVTTFLLYLLKEMKQASIGCKKAIKLLYLCDRAMFASHWKFITNDVYVSMSKGPVLVNTNSLMQMTNEIPTSFFGHYFSKNGDELKVREGIKLDDFDYSTLTAAEKRMAEYHADLFSECTEENIIKFTHSFCEEWKDPIEEGVAIRPISIEDIKRALIPRSENGA